MPSQAQPLISFFRTIVLAAVTALLITSVAPANAADPGHQADLPMADSPCFHSQAFELVLPAASTSYSNAAEALFNFASFCEVVR